MEKPSPVLVQPLFPELLNSLLALLADLSPAEWERPTVAAGWTVKDVALHLLGDELGALSYRRDRFSEPGPALASWGDLVAHLNQRNDAWVQITRRLSARVLCDLMRWSGDQAYEYWRSLDPYALGRPVSWAGPDRAPVWLDLAREYTERWHHQQHIRDAVGKPGLLEPRYLAPVLATFVYALPQTYREIDAPEGTGLALVISGESGGAWSLVREAGKWALYLDRPEQPAAQVTLGEEAAWRLFTKGLSLETARSQARLEGDPGLAARMLETVSIIA